MPFAVETTHRRSAEQGPDSLAGLVRHSSSPVRLAAISTLLLTLGACDQQGDAGPGGSAPELIRIALVGQTKQDATWPVLQAAARWFSGRSVRAETEAMAPDSASPEAQERMLRGLVGQPFHAVCIVPSDPDAIRTAVQGLVRHGKRVVIIGRDIPQSNRHAYCGPSEFEVGRAAVRACTGALMGRAKSIILLHGGSGEGFSSDRYFGFKNALPMLRDVQVLRELDCGGKILDALRLLRAESHRYPRVGCWVMLDDWPLRAASETERLLPLGCGIVLCNASPRHFARLRDGQILALVGYDFHRAVREALFAAARAAQTAGQTDEGSFDAPTEIITVRELPSYEARWKQWQGELVPTTAASAGTQEERAQGP